MVSLLNSISIKHMFDYLVENVQKIVNGRNIIRICFLVLQNDIAMKLRDIIALICGMVVRGWGKGA